MMNKTSESSWLWATVLLYFIVQGYENRFLGLGVFGCAHQLWHVKLRSSAWSPLKYPEITRTNTHQLLCHVMQTRGGSESASSVFSGKNALRRWSNSLSTPPPVRKPQQSSGPLRSPIVEDVSEKSDTTSLRQQTGTSCSRDETKDIIDAFLTRDDRNSFIARVYAILTGQLIVTLLSIFAFAQNRDLAYWMLTKGKAATFLLFFTSLYAWIRMSESEKARRESPTKWRLLALFTVGEATSIGLVSSFYAMKTVASAMMSTAAATLAVTLYTLMQTNPKYDLSQWGAGLSSCGIIFVVYGFIHLFETFGILPRGFLPYSEVIYSALGACLFSFYLAFHTRLIVSGKHSKYQMNEKDYVYGSMCLYMDIINIFLYLLRVLGEDRE